MKEKSLLSDVYLTGNKNYRLFHLINLLCCICAHAETIHFPCTKNICDFLLTDVLSYKLIDKQKRYRIILTFIAWSWSKDMPSYWNSHFCTIIKLLFTNVLYYKLIGKQQQRDIIILKIHSMVPVDRHVQFPKSRSYNKVR